MDMQFYRNSGLRVGAADRCPGPEADRPARSRQPDVTGSSELPLIDGLAPSGISATLPVDLSSVLVIEADPEMRGMLRFCLEQRNFQVLEAASGSEAIELADGRLPTLIVLDIDLADADGVSVLRSLRERSRSHILVLSRRADESHKLCVLDAGANDFLARPLSVAELAARLRAAQRFSPSCVKVSQLGDLTVDFNSRVVKVGERVIRLTATEFSLLELFVRNTGKVLTHAQILREIWGPRMLKRIEYLRVYLKSLREKLEEDPARPRLLVTERYVGYRLAIPGS